MCLAISWLPAIFGRDTIQRVSELAYLAGTANPYFVPQYGGLVYLRSPVVILSAFIFFLSPGLLFALLVKSVRSLPVWVLYGFTISLVLISSSAAIIQQVVAQPLQGLPFALVVIAFSLTGLIAIFVQQLRGQTVTIPLYGKSDWWTLFSMLAVPFLLLLFLAPKFYWENFNGDGAQTLETARLLLFRLLPFWEPSAGEVSGFPGFSSMLYAYPVSWFLRLFGASETSVRIPYLLFLIVLFAAIMALVEHDINFKLKTFDKWLTWLILVIFTIVLAYSATYSQYFADLALPATQDTLFLALFLGFTLAFFRREKIWWALFLILALMTLPSGTILVGFWLLALAIVQRPTPWRKIWGVLAIVLVFQVCTLLASWLLARQGLPTPGNEYGFIGLFSRFAFLQWEDWQRLLFIIVPTGILPALSILAWKWQDEMGRLFSVLTLLYFLFFYFQAYTVLHYYIPAMIFPVIVFWRIKPIRIALQSAWTRALVAGIILAALLLSLPASFEMDQKAREIGSKIIVNTGDYAHMDPNVYRSSELLSQLFPYDWNPEVAEEGYRGSPLAWFYYAQKNDSKVAEATYLIQSKRETPPTGMHLIASSEAFSLYLRSEADWASDRVYDSSRPSVSSTYAIAPSLIFRAIPHEGRPTIINVMTVLQKLGLDTDKLLQRLGITNYP